MGERRVERTELDRERNRDGMADRRDQGEIGGFDAGRAPAGIGRDMVEVELEGIRTRLLDPAGVADPAAGSRRVQAGDDRHGDGRLDPLERGDVAIGRADERFDRWKVGQRFRERLRALLERAAELDLLGQDLLFEQRWQDDRPDAGRLETAGHLGLAVLRCGRGDERRPQVEPEVASPKVHAHVGAPSPWLPPPVPPVPPVPPAPAAEAGSVGARWGTVRSTPASCW